MERIGGGNDVVAEQAFDVDGVEVAAATAVFAGNLDTPLLREGFAGFGLAKHAQYVLGLFGRTATAEFDGPRRVNAHIVLGKQLPDKLQPRLAVARVPSVRPAAALTPR